MKKGPLHQGLAGPTCIGKAGALASLATDYWDEINQINSCDSYPAAAVRITALGTHRSINSWH